MPPPCQSVATRADGPTSGFGEGEDEWIPDGASDYAAIRAGYVSLTPLQSDMTAVSAAAFVKGLGLER